MSSFFKTFFASLFALIVFSLVVLLIVVLFVGGLTSKNVPRIHSKSVLVLDLSQHFMEQEQRNYLGALSNESQKDVPGLYDVIRLLQKAKEDDRIAGIYIKANSSPNGFAASTELRNALEDFKKSKKFIYAQGDVISQRAYSVANIADKIYLSPQGMLEWMGFSVEYVFLKGTLEKLNIEPQIFYAGKFKSATEPLRTDRMTPENELQTTVWLNDLYDEFLQTTAIARGIDTSTLHRLANEGRIRSARDAVENKLVDGLKYDDEVNDEIRKKLGIGKTDLIQFVSIGAYKASGSFTSQRGERIALIYAEGDIVDGKGEVGVISSENYRKIIRNARMDPSIKAIVFRINSGGGSSMASENIWRELSLAKKEKPVIVSFGDVAASGGYYVSCAADSIFASSSTITGSIGVFGIIPNLQEFFRNKLGITFDGVSTGPYADAGAPYRPLKEDEKIMIQEQIELTYAQFKQRVAEGRKKDTSYVETIAQGRVWTGKRAKGIGLIDRFAGIDEAVKSAAKMAKIDRYSVSEFPEQEDILDRIFGKTNPFSLDEKIKSEVGEENYKLYKELKRVKEMSNRIQTRIPFQFFIK